MSKQRGSLATIALVFLAAILIWSSTLVAVPFLSTKLTESLEECKSEEQTQCTEKISLYGATGDMFGAATSLFSGLALFAVAFTLAQDLRARSESRKPFLIASLEQEDFILHDPKIGQSKSISYFITVKISNQTTDAALNVSAKANLVTSSTSKPLAGLHLQQPLNGTSSESITFRGNLDASETMQLLDILTDANKHATLAIEVNYASLESISWKTSVTYELRCENSGQRDKLNSVRSDSEHYLDLWRNDAAVALDTSVKDNSWSHSKI
ncbi:hypothetical protein HU751_004530 [Pseudomonas sp. BW13M1]|uniref:Uncharacterized protein n=1 Tax=Pseudomonas peradeniyensis TaxID=2745488 RepID=A0A923GCU4_9PSED|nr:hypothetical protein [Pseudomonas peradeniyensis]MBV4504105.1 hypothetical protein [Pseudomonas peradeniyensis]